jgi:hypothetical protein
MCNKTNRERVEEFLNKYVDLCAKYGLVLVGKIADDLVVPADIETMRKTQPDTGFENWLEDYFDFVISDKTIDYCVEVIERNE